MGEPIVVVTMCIPVSVCHQVSTIGRRFLPTTVWNHSHASGLRGSPTDPSTRKYERSYWLGHCSPIFMNIRIAVGAV